MNKRNLHTEENSKRSNDGQVSGVRQGDRIMNIVSTGIYNMSSVMRSIRSKLLLEALFWRSSLLNFLSFPWTTTDMWYTIRTWKCTCVNDAPGADMFPSVPVVFSLFSTASNTDVRSLAFPSLLCPISEPPTPAVTVLAKKGDNQLCFHTAPHWLRPGILNLRPINGTISHPVVRNRSLTVTYASLPDCSFVRLDIGIGHYSLRHMS